MFFFNLHGVEEPILTHQCSARLQDELSVVQSNYRIHYSFFFKPRVEHVHREHFTPLSNRTHLKMTENSIHSTRDISRNLAFLISRSRGLSREPSLLASPPPPLFFCRSFKREETVSKQVESRQNYCGKRRFEVISRSSKESIGSHALIDRNKICLSWLCKS